MKQGDYLAHTGKESKYSGMILLHQGRWTHTNQHNATKVQICGPPHMIKPFLQKQRINKGHERDVVGLNSTFWCAPEQVLEVIK